MRQIMERIATPFGATSTAAEVVRGISLAGRAAIVTGAASGIGGRYFEDCHEAEIVSEIIDGVHGVLPHALDPAAASRLWDVSLNLLNHV